MVGFAFEESFMNYFKPERISEPDYKNYYFYETLHDELLENPFSKECIVVQISDSEYEICDKTSHGDNYKANSNPGKFGKGLISNTDDQFRTARVGLLGEMAFAKIMNLQVDISFRPFGDISDFMLEKYKTDIKCHYGLYKTDPYNFEQHTTERGTIKQINKDLYIQSFLENEDRAAKTAQIVFIGYYTRRMVEKSQKVSSARGSFLNHKLTFVAARPIQELVKRFGIV